MILSDFVCQHVSFIGLKLVTMNNGKEKGSKAALLKKIFTVLHLWIKEYFRSQGVWGMILCCWVFTDVSKRNIFPSSLLVNSRKWRRFEGMTRTTYMTTRSCITDNINPSQIRCGNLKYCKAIFIMAVSMLKRNVHAYTLSWVTEGMPVLEVQSKCMLNLNNVLLHTKNSKTEPQIDNTSSSSSSMD
jgi:hypothetical protein